MAARRGWKTHLFDVRRSMFREIISRVAVCAVFATIVVAFHHLVHPIAIPLQAHTLIGLAMGLLLVFRTNASYDRYWEGRRLWGGLINESRNLGRTARAYLSAAPELVGATCDWTAAFAYATMNSLRGERSIGPVDDRLPPEQVEQVLLAENVPLAVSDRLSQNFAAAESRGALSEYKQVELDRIVQVLVNHAGSCGRIRGTPLPFVYVAHLRRALILYIFTLPLALVESYGWFTIAVVPILGYILFGIEEIGVEIENPFGRDVNDLPLENFCEMIDRDLAELTSSPRRQTGETVVDPEDLRLIAPEPV